MVTRQKDILLIKTFSALATVTPLLQMNICCFAVDGNVFDYLLSVIMYLVCFS